MAKINQLPVGIASILGIKSSGVSPYMLLDEVRAGFDATRFYFCGQERGGVNTASASALGFTASGTYLVVPPGEFWVVTDYSARAVTAAAEAIALAAAFREAVPNNAGTATTLQCAIGPHASCGASQACSSALHYSPFILGPGSQLGVLINQITTAGSIPVTLTGRYYRLL